VDEAATAAQATAAGRQGSRQTAKKGRQAARSHNSHRRVHAKPPPPQPPSPHTSHLHVWEHLVIGVQSLALRLGRWGSRQGEAGSNQTNAKICTLRLCVGSPHPCCWPLPAQSTRGQAQQLSCTAVPLRSPALHAYTAQAKQERKCQGSGLGGHLRFRRSASAGNSHHTCGAASTGTSDGTLECCTPPLSSALYLATPSGAPGTNKQQLLTRSPSTRPQQLAHSPQPTAAAADYYSLTRRRASGVRRGPHMSPSWPPGSHTPASKQTARVNSSGHDLVSAWHSCSQVYTVVLAGNRVWRACGSPISTPSHPCPLALCCCPSACRLFDNPRSVPPCTLPMLATFPALAPPHLAVAHHCVLGWREAEGVAAAQRRVAGGVKQPHVLQSQHTTGHHTQRLS